MGSSSWAGKTIIAHAVDLTYKRNIQKVSPDRGRTWQRPQWLDGETDDAGYGDTSWDPKTGEYVASLYQGAQEEAVLKQYKFTIKSRSE